MIFFFFNSYKEKWFESFIIEVNDAGDVSNKRKHFFFDAAYCVWYPGPVVAAAGLCKCQLIASLGLRPASWGRARGCAAWAGCECERMGGGLFSSGFPPLFLASLSRVFILLARELGGG